MHAVILLIFPLGIAFVVFLVIAAARGTWAANVTVEPGDVAAAGAATRRLRIRLFAMFGLFVVLTGSITLDSFHTQPGSWLGIGQSLGPGVAAIITVLLLAIRPLPAWGGTAPVRSAELAPRTGGSFGPRWGFLLPLASAALLVLFLVATGLSGSADESGLQRQISNGDGSSAGPYPGWFYGVPLIIVTVLLAVSVLVVLHRIAAAPRPVNPSLYSLDDSLRRAATRFVMLLSSSALLVYFAAVAILAGSATSNTGTSYVLKPGADALSNSYNPSREHMAIYHQPLVGIGVGEYVLGGVFVLLAIVLFFGALVVAGMRWAPAVATATPTVEAAQEASV